MAEPLTIRQANALNAQELLVTLSDGRSVLLTLAQVLGLGGRVLPAEEPEQE